MWSATPALGRAVLLTGLFALAGVLLGRPDLVLLAAPFALGTGWALRRRPSALPETYTGVDPPSVVEGGQIAGTVGAANPGLVGYDLVVLRTARSRWLWLPEADRPHAVAVPAERAADLSLVGTARRWGRHRIGPASATAYACDGLLCAAGAASFAPAAVAVYPETEPFQADEAMPRAAGLIGAHRSRRPGEGGELAGVRAYAPGDRLRRVDWRVSLRTRQLHVAATLSDRDAELVLVLDVLTEAGRSGGIRGTASVLDTAVRAAAAIAEHYLHRGDRVSLVEYGGAGRRLRPASGRRQYLTVLEWLLDLRPGGQLDAPDGGPFGDACEPNRCRGGDACEPNRYRGGDVSEPNRYRGGDACEPNRLLAGPHLLAPASLLASSSLIVVLTPLIDAGTAPMLARLARAGRHVVAVDTLPADLPAPVPPGPARRPRPVGPHAALAYRLWRLERDNTVGALREHGVPVVGWAGAGSLDHVLRDVARRAPRISTPPAHHPHRAVR